LAVHLCSFVEKPAISTGFIRSRPSAELANLAEQDGTIRYKNPETTTLQIIRVFTKYATAHPEKLDLSAAAVAYSAMADEFPCRQ
jgi:hypothetical protein